MNLVLASGSPRRKELLATAGFQFAVRAVDIDETPLPGESPADFDDTMTLTAQVRFHSMFSFKYSPRPRTLAIKRLPDDVAEDEKTRRIVALQALQREIQFDLHRQAVGRVEGVLIDSGSRRREQDLSGRTSGNTVVNFPGEPGWLGRLARVRVTAAGPNSLRGEVLNVEA